MATVPKGPGGKKHTQQRNRTKICLRKYEKQLPGIQWKAGDSSGYGETHTRRRGRGQKQMKGEVIKIERVGTE